MRQLAFATLTLLLATTLGCGDRQRNELGTVEDTMPAPTTAAAPEVPDTAPAEADFTFDQREQFTQSIRQQLTDIDREIDQLASQAKSQGGAVSDRALANIRASRQRLTRDLNRVSAATAANWEQVKDRVDQSLDNLNEAIEVAQPK
jgi:small-conductance mechanosensitive channel